MADRAAFVDDSGETRLSGELFYPGSTADDVLTVQADGSIAAAAVSPGLVTESGYYQGNTVNVANGANGTIGFDFPTSGAAVLNVTNPLLPTAVKAGLFIVSLEIEAGTLTAGGSFQASLIMDVTGDAPEIDGSAVAASNFVRNLATVVGSYVLSAGDAIRVDVTNGDGAATRGFSITNAFVSRIGPA